MLWRNCGDLPRPTKEGLRLIDVNPYALYCRREDSNLHSLNGNQVLNLKITHLPGRAFIGPRRGKSLRPLGLQHKFALFARP